METELIRRELMIRLSESWRGLGDKPDETPEGTLRELWRFVAARPDEKMQWPELDAAAVKSLKALVERRLAGEPLSYLIGRQRFMGLDLLAEPGAMIPRRETEILGYAALERLKQLVKDQGVARVIDLCTGSGNIALSLAWHEPGCRVFGSDISKEAVALAQRNAVSLGLEDRVSFQAGDFLEPFLTEAFRGSVDLVTCNPPYISSAKVEKMDHEISNYEPRAAFDGGPFGISLLNRLIKEAPQVLKEGGWVACETGLGQGEAMSRLFQKSMAYCQVLTFTDDAGQVRVILAQTGIQREV